MCYLSLSQYFYRTFENIFEAKKIIPRAVNTGCVQNISNDLWT